LKFHHPTGEFRIADVRAQGEKSSANGRLIAAAPELLQILEDFTTQATDYLLDSRRTLDESQWRATIREARNVIAKVKGE
jgi:hypothetical protein